MSSRAIELCLETAKNMLTLVRKKPFYLSSGSNKTRNSEAFCAEFEQMVQIGEESYWKERVEYYEGRNHDITEILPDSSQ